MDNNGQFLFLGAVRNNAISNARKSNNFGLGDLILFIFLICGDMLGQLQLPDITDLRQHVAVISAPYLEGVIRLVG